MVRAKISKTPFEVGIRLGSWQNRENTLCGRPLVRVRAKLEKNTVCVWPFVRARKNRENKPFVVGLW